MAAKYIPPHLRRPLASAEASAAADTEPSDSIDPVNPAGSTVNESEAKIRDVKLVATYNWIDKSAPTILVPGERVYDPLRCIIIVVVLGFGC